MLKPERRLASYAPKTAGREGGPIQRYPPHRVAVGLQYQARFLSLLNVTFRRHPVGKHCYVRPLNLHQC
jgi:hypothetical protein